MKECRDVPRLHNKEQKCARHSGVFCLVPAGPANPCHQHGSRACYQHPFPRGPVFFWNYSEWGQALCVGFSIPLTTCSQTLTLQKTLNSYSRFFAQVSVNKKCNTNREGLGSSQHEICPMLVSQAQLLAPEGLASVRPALWEGSQTAFGWVSQPRPTAMPTKHPALTVPAFHYWARINLPALYLLQTGIAVVKDVEISFKIWKSVNSVIRVMFSHLPFLFPSSNL